MTNKIEVAFVFASTSRGTENDSSDINVLIIGTVSLSQAVNVLYDSQTIIKLEINPKISHREEWKKLVKSNNSFIKEILKKPKLFIIGNKHDIE